MLDSLRNLVGSWGGARSPQTQPLHVPSSSSDPQWVIDLAVVDDRGCAMTLASGLGQFQAGPLAAPSRSEAESRAARFYSQVLTSRGGHQVAPDGRVDGGGCIRVVRCVSQGSRVSHRKAALRPDSTMLVAGSGWVAGSLQPLVTRGGVGLLVLMVGVAIVAGVSASNREAADDRLDEGSATAAPVAPGGSVAQAGSSPGDRLLESAKRLFHAHRYSEARTQAKQALDIYRNAKVSTETMNVARHIVAESALELGLYDEADSMFQALSCLDPNDKAARAGRLRAQAALRTQSVAAAKRKAEAEERERQARISARAREEGARRKAAETVLVQAGGLETRAVSYAAPVVEVTAGRRTVYRYTNPQTGLQMTSSEPPRWYRPGCSSYVVLYDRQGKMVGSEPIPQNDYILMESRARSAETQSRNEALIEQSRSQAAQQRARNAELTQGALNNRYPGTGYAQPYNPQPAYQPPSYARPSYGAPSIPGVPVPGQGGGYAPSIPSMPTMPMGPSVPAGPSVPFGR